MIGVNRVADQPGLQFKCAVCDDDRPAFSWTDTHGVAKHLPCGALYRLYHYDAEDKPIDNPPTLMLKAGWLPYLRRYWQEERRSVWGGACSFGFENDRDRDDAKALSAWFKANVPAELLNEAR